MISLAEVEYSNTCLNPESSSSEIVDAAVKFLEKSFKGFVLTVVDDNDNQYTATNLENLEAFEVIDTMLDVLNEDP
jgi:hypothetical protein